ncbi:hypothetical protein B0H13DRAFT_2580658 [Mycena leptocephala]|nr:hypothetical protein B0H13DRAFT_2580658 [Mycena leptocephala]
MAEVSPTLPLELECRIFETAVLSRPVSIPAMRHVMWHVKHWLEPLLYRLLVFTDSKRLLERFLFLNQGIFKHLMRTKPALLCDTICNVMVCYEQYIYEAEVANEPHITRIQALPLRCIHCDLVELIHSAMAQPFRISSLTHFTHLGLLYWFDQAANSVPEACKLHTRLRELPQLTHLSVPSHTSDSDTPILAHLLDICKSLWALIVLEALTLQTEEMMSRGE